jgi:superfamily I DNA/RNA helicase
LHEEWNRANPILKITPVKKERKLDGEESGEDFVGRGPTGDYLLGELNRARGRMIPEQIWSPALRDFAVRWNRYKDSRRVLDFCDLIETASRELPTVPGNPQVIFADEAQDLNPMQLNLVRKWGQNARYFVIAIDDDQTIYSWCSATPEAVLDPDIPENHKIFLKQSYRVPRAVHARADRLIRQVSRREKKVYEPRAEDGVCLELSQGGYKSPEYWILKAIMKHLEQG